MPLTLYRRGAIWHYRGTVAGRQLRGSTRTADKAIAEQIKARLEDRQWKSHLHGPETVLSFADAVMLYLQAGKSDRYILRLLDHWKETPVRQINAGQVRDAARRLYPHGAAATLNRQVIGPTVAIINHAAERQLCPPLRMKRFKVEKREKTPATWDWVQAFMAHARPNQAALCCFLFLTGARITEAVRLTWDDVDLQAGRALIRQTKVGAERRAHMPPVLVAALANLPRDHQRVFGYLSRHAAKHGWRRVIDRAGIRPLSFHACRHGFATAMLQEGVDPVTVAKLGGWQDVGQLWRTYGHAAEDDTLANRIARRKG